MAPIKILAKYYDYADVFTFDLAMKLPENTGINKYAIELIERKQPPYEPIYGLSLVDLKILKVYIKTHLKTRFIKPFKYLTKTPILFDKKLDCSLHLYIDYQGLNNLIIKNRYPLLLIGISLEQVDRAKQFT